MRFIAFDLETTGVVPGVDAIVEIGAVRFENDQPTEVFATLVDPQRPIPPGAAAVNGITDEMLKGKPLIEDLLESFASFCGEDLIVAHNASFDAQFLTSAIKKHEASAPKGIIIDTLSLSRKAFPGFLNYRLSTLVQNLKIPASGFHRAQEDASYCGYLFSRILKKLSPTGEVSTELLIKYTGKPELKFPQIVKQPKQLSLLDFG